MRGKKRPRLQQEAIVLLVDGKPRQEVAEIVGVDDSTLWRWMQRADFQEALAAAKAGPKPKPRKRKIRRLADTDPVAAITERMRHRVRELFPDWPADDPRLVLMAESIKDEKLTALRDELLQAQIDASKQRGVSG